MKAAVHVDDFAGAERQQVLGNGGDGFADILGHAPAFDRGQALLDQLVSLLEDAGLVRRQKVGRTNVLTLNRMSMRSLQVWLEQFHTHWGNERATLENYDEYVSRTT